MGWVSRTKITLESCPGLPSWLPAPTESAPTNQELAKSVPCIQTHYINRSMLLLVWQTLIGQYNYWLLGKDGGLQEREDSNVKNDTSDLHSEQHLYGSSLPSFPSWWGCGTELIPDTTSLGAIPMAATISNANMACIFQITWAESFSIHANCTVPLYLLFHQLHNYRYFLEVSTEIEQSSTHQDYDIQEKKRMIRIV